MPKNFHCLVQLLNLKRFLEDCNRADLKDAIQNLAVGVTRDDDHVQLWINLFGRLVNLVPGCIRQLQIQEHEVKLLLSKAGDGIFSRSDHDTAEADFLEERSEQFLQARVVIHYQDGRLTLFILPQDVTVERGFLDAPATTDLNGGDLPALDQVVNRRQWNAKILGSFFDG